MRISEQALRAAGWQIDALYASRLLPPINDGAIVELQVMPLPEGGGEWLASLIQGVPDDPRVTDDQVTITSGRFTTMEQLEALIVALSPGSAR